MTFKLYECPHCGARAVVEEEINIFRCQLCGEHVDEAAMEKKNEV